VISFDWLQDRFLGLKLFWRFPDQVFIFLGSLTESALVLINDERLLVFFFNILWLQLLIFLFFFLEDDIKCFVVFRR
jgi:hypothetical protein